MRIKRLSARDARRLLAVGLFSVALHFLMLLLFCLIERQSFSFVISDRLMSAGDAVRYLDIARNGYVTEGENAINLVFYPLYPLLIRVFSFLGGYAVSGTVISTACLGLGSAVLYSLTRQEWDETAALWSVLFFNFYPYSVFSTGVYSESLFLLLSLLTVLYLRRDDFLRAGIFGFLASLTRVHGMLLLFPALCQWLLRRRKARPRDLWLLLIPCGFGVYLLINTVLHGDPFQFLIYEANDPWFQTTRWIGSNIAQHAVLAKEYPSLGGIIYLPQIALYFASAVLLFTGIRQCQPFPLLVYGGVYLGFTYLSGWMISGGRYIYGCFPLFLILARIRCEWFRTVLLVLCVFLFFSVSCFYLSGFAIM